jgi:hypothetical protein
LSAALVTDIEPGPSLEGKLVMKSMTEQSGFCFLNPRLAGLAMSQYLAHLEMCDNWGYGKLHKATEKQSHEECCPH